MQDSNIKTKQLRRRSRKRSIRRQTRHPKPINLEAISLPTQQGFLRRMMKGEQLMHYNRLIMVVLLSNIALAFFGISNGWWWIGNAPALSALSNMVLANLTIAIIVRQHYVINFLFWMATSAPTSWPLGIRRILGKVYHFGGIHVGGAIAGTTWFALLVAAMVHQYVTGTAGISMTTMIISGLLLVTLLIIILMALPSQRAKHHDRFEMSHRFGGWTALALFWAQNIMFTIDQHPDTPLSEALFASPGFWLLLLVTFSIALPWLRLRKVPVSVERPSGHVALAKFGHVTPFAGSSTALSRSPLTEWHSFANVPAPGEQGFRLTISRAGDWTGDFIDELPAYIWVKGIPTAGVGNIDQLFKKVVWVATGSGIGPCLPHLLSREVPAKLIWSTRSPRKTYGDEFVDEILSVQPDAIIWDTDKKGRPDLVKLAWMAMKEFEAEAVICISNKKLTWQVVYGMESRGLPAYGAIWDS